MAPLSAYPPSGNYCLCFWIYPYSVHTIFLKHWVTLYLVFCLGWTFPHILFAYFYSSFIASIVFHHIDIACIFPNLCCWTVKFNLFMSLLIWNRCPSRPHLPKSLLIYFGYVRRNASEYSPYYLLKRLASFPPTSRTRALEAQTWEFQGILEFGRRRGFSPWSFGDIPCTPAATQACAFSSSALLTFWAR